MCASVAAGATSKEVAITGDIEDRNEAPTLDPASYSFTVTEDKDPALPVATASLTVSASFPADVTGRPDGAAVFMVNPIVGQVKARAGLDFATTTQYGTRVEVYINIDVTDTNEAPLSRAATAPSTLASLPATRLGYSR